MTKTKDMQIGRLALRVQGDKWVAYYALPGTMDGALWLGEIHMALVQKLERKRAFIVLMRDVVSDIIEKTIGSRPTWPNPEQPAPEHERAGRA